MINEMQGKFLGGRYRLIRPLGEGGFGQTYLAEDNQLPDNPQCVVKQLKPKTTDAATLEVARRLFDMEARTLHKLGSHDQIPRLLAHFEENEEFYLVQEYVEGNTLSQELNSGKRLSEIEVISILEDILSTLEYVHQQNVIHRDIKPSNLIRRNQDGKLVLIDFGAVKQISTQGANERGENQLTVPISTQGYTPSEQLAGRPRFNSDIYATGMTAIQTLTGKHPKQLPQDLDTGKVIWRELVLVSDQFAAILDKMVCPYYQERYQSVADVVHDLKNLANLSYAPTELIKKDAKGLQNTSQETKLPPTELIKKDSTALQNTSQETQLPSVASSKPSWRRFVKPWYILGTLAFAIAILGSVEFFYPTFRPIYYLHRGKQLLELQQPEAALENFQQITDNIKPNEPKAWKGKGDALFMLERQEGALAAYEKALQLQPNDPKIFNNKGRILYQLGRYQDALAAHDQALKIDPDNAKAWSGKGIALIGLQRYKEALTAFDKARSIKPQDPTVWQSKGLALDYLQQRPEAVRVYEEALAVYDETLKKKPNDQIVWVDRGSVLLKLQRTQEALDSYNKALQINPDFYPALLGKGNILTILHKYELALKVYEQACKVRPRDHLAWYNRGEVLAQGLKDYKEAVKSFDKALELRPEFYDAWLRKGLALSLLKQYSAALTAYDKAKNIESNDPFLWANRGFVLEKLQRNKEALDSYNKAIEIKPDFTEVIESRKQLLKKLGK